MSNKSPIFPMPDTQLFSDYGFHPHFDYFQVVEEARKQKREKKQGGGKSTDGSSQHFKLQKPKMIKKNKHNNNRKRWWKHALHFFKGKLLTTHDHNYNHHAHAAAAVHCIASSPPPIYITESRSGSTTPCRTTRRPMSCPASPSIMRTEMDNLSYISLTDINNQHRISASSPMPIYLVT